MQISNITRALVSGGILYVAMAACSASNNSSLWSSDIADAGEGSGGRANDDRDLYADASRGEGGNGLPDGSDGQGGSWLDAALDAITDPVPDAAAAEDGTKDGSRLKARYYVSEDGARQFATWFDTQRGEECTFQMAADGKRRCMPTAIIFGTTGYYADATCSQNLLLDSSGCADASLVGTWDSTGYCGGQYRQRIYPITGKFTGSAVYYFANGTCTGIPKGTSEYLQFGAEIPASSFVAATIE